MHADKDDALRGSCSVDARSNKGSDDRGRNYGSARSTVEGGAYRSVDRSDRDNDRRYSYNDGDGDGDGAGGLLCQLVLDENAVSDASALLLLGMCRSLPSLSCLHVRANNIADRGALLFAQVGTPARPCCVHPCTALLMRVCGGMDG